MAELEIAFQKDGFIGIFDNVFEIGILFSFIEKDNFWLFIILLKSLIKPSEISIEVFAKFNNFLANFNWTCGW